MKFIPNFIKNRLRSIVLQNAERILNIPIRNDFIRYSFSQEGEDLILLSLFDQNLKPGFYVDIGAHHPFRYSNTMIFYLNGWRGINIDATPGSMELFKLVRPRDINIESAISEKEELLDFYQFNDSALNGFSSKLSQSRISERHYIVNTIQLKTKSINSILEEYLEGHEISFLTIDVEGFDLQILKTIDFNRFSPKYILAESLDDTLGELYEYLAKNKYSLIAKTIRTHIFEKKG